MHPDVGGNWRHIPGRGVLIHPKMAPHCVTGIARRMGVGVASVRRLPLRAGGRGEEQRAIDQGPLQMIVEAKTAGNLIRPKCG
jgi:hypothetical protein